MQGSVTWLSKWERVFIDDLCELKARGYDFHGAWTMALAMRPPSARERRCDEDSQSMVDFLYDVCFDAWHGHRAALAHLPSIFEAAFEPSDVQAARGRVQRGAVGSRLVA